MTTFNDREKSFENKFKHDQDTLFRIHSRRNKLLGQWAADLMGLTGDAVGAYATEVVMSDMEKPGDDDVHDKVYADLQAKNIDLNLIFNRDGFIKVDEYMRTDQPDIFAIGDCAEKRDFFTRKRSKAMLASIACA